VQLGGKQDAQGGVLSAVNPGSLFYINESISNQNFLVDSGSSFSILPCKSSAPQHGPRLTAANGRRIECWGHNRASVVLNGVTYRWKFLRATVKFPILGADFLPHHSLLIDMPGGRLIQQAVPPPPALAAGGNLVAAAVTAWPPQQLQEPWQSLLQQFSSLVPPTGQLPPPNHGVQHHITTSGQPVTGNFRRLDPERLAVAKAEFDAMLAAGIICRSNSSWSSPLHRVRKKDGGWRFSPAQSSHCCQPLPPP
jgi:cleavage and polyadenylation specificity factor subunit 1